MRRQRARLTDARGNGSLIFNRNRQIAAIFTIRIAGDSHPSAESEGEVAGRIEPGQRRQIAGYVLHADLPAAQRIDLDPPRELDPYRPARLTVDARGADDGARTDPGDRAFRGARPVGTNRRRALTLAEEDQPVEVEAALDLGTDVATVDGVRAGGRGPVAQTALRSRRPPGGCGFGAGR